MQQSTRQQTRPKPVLVAYQSRVDDDDDDGAVSVGPIPSVSSFRGKWFRDPRKCERPNHVPHLTPIISDYHEWTRVYGAQLEQLFNLLVGAVNEVSPRNGIKWDKDPRIASNFCKVIYHCSSKHMSPYIESPSKDVREDD